jgi:RNA polymerase sigma-70 factor (ECF subfamily)
MSRMVERAGMVRAIVTAETEGSLGPTSFEAFFQAEYARLARALYLVTGDPVEAEDLAQEAMVRVYERWDRLSIGEPPVGYLYRTALNLHRSRGRRLAVRMRRAARLSPASDPLSAADDRDELGRMLSSLPETQRAALVLVEWLGMSAEEAAPALGIEPVSVRVRVSRAKAALRERAGRTNDERPS